MQPLRITLLLFLVLHISQDIFSQESEKVRVGEFVGITFPSEPIHSESAAQEEYVLTDTNGCFQARFLKTNFSQTIQWGPDKNLQKFYREFLEGMVGQINATVNHAEYFKIKGYMAVDADLNYTDPKTGLEMSLFVRVITLNGKIYNVAYTNLSDVFDDYTAEKDAFINSFELLIDSQDQIGDAARPTPNKPESTGDMILRFIIIIVGILSVTIGAIYFVTYKSKAERARETNDF